MHPAGDQPNVRGIRQGGPLTDFKSVMLALMQGPASPADQAPGPLQRQHVHDLTGGRPSMPLCRRPPCLVSSCCLQMRNPRPPHLSNRLFGSAGDAAMVVRLPYGRHDQVLLQHRLPLLQELVRAATHRCVHALCPTCRGLRGNALFCITPQRSSQLHDTEHARPQRSRHICLPCRNAPGKRLKHTLAGLTWWFRHPGPCTWTTPPTSAPASCGTGTSLPRPAATLTVQFKAAPCSRALGCAKCADLSAFRALSCRGWCIWSIDLHPQKQSLHPNLVLAHTGSYQCLSTPSHSSCCPVQAP